MDVMGSDAPVVLFAVPQCLAEAHQLATTNPAAFRAWVRSLLHAWPLPGEDVDIGDHVEGAPVIDSAFTVVEEPAARVHRIVVQVASPQVAVGAVEALCAAMEGAGATIGVLIVQEWPTPALERAAEAAGYYAAGWLGQYARVQIITVAELLKGRRVDLPSPWWTRAQSAPADLRAA